MSSNDRRIRARRRAWGHGPMILRFEPLEGRQLLSGLDPLAALASAVTSTTTVAGATTPSATSTTNTATAATPTTTVTSTSTATPATVSTPVTKPVAIDHSNFAATAISTPHNLDWGDPFHAAGSIQNNGSGPSLSTSKINIYASLSPALDSKAVLLGTATIAAGVPAGSMADFDQLVTAPRVPLANLGSAPSYYIIPQLVGNSSTTPSSLVGPLLNSVVTITPKVPPKLVATGISVSPGSVSWGDVINVTASVANQSLGGAPPTNSRVVLTPTGKTPGGSSDYQIGQVSMPAIGGFQTSTQSQTIILPKYVPTALAGFSSYIVTLIPDADAAANVVVSATVSTSSSNSTHLTIAAPAVPAATTPQAADLTVIQVAGPSTIYRGATFTVGATIENTGPGDAGPFKVRFLLETDSSTNAYVLGDASISGLGSGTEQDVAQVVTLPFRIPDGFPANSSTARIVVEVDPNRSINQINTTNDRLTGSTVPFKLLSADGQTTLPVLTGTTSTTPTTTTTTTTTTPITPTATPTTTTTTPAPAPTTTTQTSIPVTTPNQPQSKAAAHQAAIVAKQAAAAAARSVAAAKKAAAATVHTQVIVHKAHPTPHPRSTARTHALKVYRPASKPY